MNILLEPGARPVIGHRGNRAHAPENTIESFAQAVALGADAIEFDVRLTADGIPVVHHDPTAARTTSGHGEISRLMFSELRSFDAGARFTKDGTTFPYRGHGHTIPTLDEVIDAFPSTPLLIEIKAPLAATQIRKSIEAHNCRDRVLIDAMSVDALRVFDGSGIAVGAGRAGVTRLMSDVLLGKRVESVAYQALCVPLNYYGLPLPVRRFAKVAPKHNCRVHVWTVNDTDVARDLWNAGVNGIISDDPAIMIKARASMASVI